MFFLTFNTVITKLFIAVLKYFPRLFLWLQGKQTDMSCDICFNYTFLSSSPDNEAVGVQPGSSSIKLKCQWGLPAPLRKLFLHKGKKMQQINYSLIFCREKCWWLFCYLCRFLMANLSIPLFSFYVRYMLTFYLQYHII